VRTPREQDRTSSEAVPESLQHYLAVTAVRPPADLAGRIEQRLALEPPPTPTRRFLAALHTRDARSMWHTLRQDAATAFAPRTRSRVRFQALATVMVALLIVSLAGAAVLATAGLVVTTLGGPPEHHRAVPESRSGRVAPPTISSDELVERRGRRTSGSDAIHPNATNDECADPSGGDPAPAPLLLPAECPDDLPEVPPTPFADEATQGDRADTGSTVTRGSQSQAKPDAKERSNGKKESQAKSGTRGQSASHAKSGDRGPSDQQTKSGTGGQSASHAKSGDRGPSASEAKSGTGGQSESHARPGDRGPSASEADPRPKTTP
jgi:hypothetical protein